MKKIFTCEFAYLGNGITVYTKDFEEQNDYPVIAHISTDRVITYFKRRLSNIPFQRRPTYKEFMSEEVISKIENYANTENPTCNDGTFIFKIKA